MTDSRIRMAGAPHVLPLGELGSHEPYPKPSDGDPESYRNLLTFRQQSNELSEKEENLKHLENVEIACEQEAKALGRTFFDAFLQMKRLVQDQPTYRRQASILSAFTAQGIDLLTDDVVVILEKTIEWKREE